MKSPNYSRVFPQVITWNILLAVKQIEKGGVASTLKWSVWRQTTWDQPLCVVLFFWSVHLNSKPNSYLIIPPLQWGITDHTAFVLFQLTFSVIFLITTLVSTVAYTSEGAGITGMLIGQQEVMGVTFQRPVAPPPIVLWTKTGRRPIGNMEIYTGNEHFSSLIIPLFPVIWDVFLILQNMRL